MNGGSRFPAFLLGALLLTACTAVSPGASSSPPLTVDQAPARTLVALVEREPVSLSSKMKQESSLTSTKRLFNAGLALIGEDSVLYPYLAETLPQLQTDTWQVFPDGRMETTYRLKLNLTWQDGTPFSAEDLVFAWQVYTTRGVDVTLKTPQDRFEEVAAPDSRTFIIRWTKLYPDAGSLTQYDFPPLPRHLLERSFREDSLDTFLAQTYWTRDYIGMGPYVLERWEPGSFVVGEAFSGHALGRPKIERIEVHFQPDQNTGLTALLAGTAQVAWAGGVGFEQALALRRAWAAGQGVVPMHTGDGTYWQIQFRPEFVSPQALLDLRIRKALAYSMNKQGFVDMQNGLALPADTLISREDPAYPEVDRVITKYPYDLRQADTLFTQVGFSKGPDGFYAGLGGKLSLEVRWNSTAENNLEGPILAERWRRAGIDAAEIVFPETRLPDGEYRATFQSLQWGGNGNIMRLLTSTIPTPENRWVGTNRGAWTNPAFDRLYDSYTTTLSRSEQRQYLVQMMKLASEELPVFTTFHGASVGTTHIAALAGVREGAAQVSDATWNVHEWYWQ